MAKTLFSVIQNWIRMHFDKKGNKSLLRTQLVPNSPFIYFWLTTTWLVSLNFGMYASPVMINPLLVMLQQFARSIIWILLAPTTDVHLLFLCSLRSPTGPRRVWRNLRKKKAQKKREGRKRRRRKRRKKKSKKFPLLLKNSACISHQGHHLGAALSNLPVDHYEA